MAAGEAIANNTLTSTLHSWVEPGCGRKALLRSESPSGMCAKLCTVVASNNRDHALQSLYCCLLPQCKALCTCCLGFPITTKWCCDQDVKVVLCETFTKRSVIGEVHCKKEMLLQPLCWRCVKCVIHHERDVREEKHWIYVARTSNSRVIAARDLNCCLLPQCEALHTCHSGFPIATA